MDNIKRDDRLAEAAREIYRTYGNNIQRYFDDLLGESDTQEQSSRHADSDSGIRKSDGRKDGKVRRVP